jgi:hypothetical protein
MYIGHVGVALAAKRGRRSIGLLVLLFATYAPDWVDTGVCLVSTRVSDGMLSHSIPAVAALCLIGFFIYGIGARDWRGALVVAGLIASHMVLDWITGNKPTWPAGPRIGLQLYTHPLADFIAEATLIVAGSILYSGTLPAASRAASLRLMATSLLCLQLGIDVAHLMVPSLTKC